MQNACPRTKKKNGLGARGRNMVSTALLMMIYLSFISLGLPDSMLGSAWPAMNVSLNAPLWGAGLVQMLISFCTIISSLNSAKLIRRFGTGKLTAISVATTALALLGFSLAKNYAFLLLMAVPLGLGAGAVDAGLNNYVALHCEVKHMSWLHCFWGVGTIVSPFIMGYALEKSVWNTGYRIVGGLQLCIAALLLATLPVWRVNESKQAAQTQKRLGLGGALKIKGVPFLLVGFFAYCAAEATAMQWASTYFVQAKGVSAERAAFLASLFYIGITVGRFISGFITGRLGDKRMIELGTGILTGGIVFLMLPVQGETAAIVGFVVIGLGCAPIYPCIIHSTPGNFGAENSGAIIGIQMASAYVGSTFVPPLYGVLGRAVGFRVMPLYLLAFFALMIVMVELTFRLTKPSPCRRKI